MVKFFQITVFSLFSVVSFLGFTWAQNELNTTLSAAKTMELNKLVREIYYELDDFKKNDHRNCWSRDEFSLEVIPDSGQAYIAFSKTKEEMEFFNPVTGRKSVAMDTGIGSTNIDGRYVMRVISYMPISTAGEFFNEAEEMEDCHFPSWGVKLNWIGLPAEHCLAEMRQRIEKCCKNFKKNTVPEKE